MKFHNQTRFLTGSTSSNNMQVVTACMLSLEVKEVPDFEGNFSLFEQHLIWKKFLFEHGFYLLKLPPEFAPYFPHIGNGKSPREPSHMVIMKGKELLWDPHPERLGLSQIKEVIVLVKDLG